MPWKETDAMREKCRFVIKALEPGANKSELCREFGISRPTGDKWISRYLSEGLDGLKEQSRRPKVSPLSTSSEVVCEIIKIRANRTSWGGKKIRPLLLRRFPEGQIPTSRTIDRILDRCGLTDKKFRRPKKTTPTENNVIQATNCNHVWTVDFKGWWYTRDKNRCEPLTIRDEFSRFIIDIVALRYTHTEIVKDCFRNCFEKYGLPEYIRSDNGPPFATATSLHGLSQLSVWWLKLGITPNRIEPGCPYQNGAHERIHKDIKKELQSNPARNIEQEQIRFDEWKSIFNYERAHESIGLTTPAEFYNKSERSYDEKEPAYEYPDSFETRMVCSYGKFNWFGKRMFLTKALAGEQVAIQKIRRNALKLWYANFCLGEYDSGFSTLKDVKPRKLNSLSTSSSFKETAYG
jgi:transposase InsO family protein